MLGKLILIPNFLGKGGDKALIPMRNILIIHQLDEYIVEHEKTARAFLKNIESPVLQDDFIFHLLNKQTKKDEIEGFLNVCFQGKTIGLMSDAGLPCVADPGYEVVKKAHNLGIDVLPLSGMSSIMLALMASGFTGQSFKFHGYLPFDKSIRKRQFSSLKKAIDQGETQIFIETPYRNHQFIGELKKNLPSDIELCMAIDLTLESEEIIRTPLKYWTAEGKQFHKRPAVFVLGR